MSYIEMAMRLKTLNASERVAANAFGISKSQAHRIKAISKLPEDLLFSASVWGTEMYLLLDAAKIPCSKRRRLVFNEIKIGKVRKRKELGEIFKTRNPH